jgi:hypothetical protein
VPELDMALYFSKGIPRKLVQKHSGSGNIPWEHSGNIQGTFREHSGNIQGIFREHSGNIQGTFREHSGNIQGTFREYSENIQGTFREHLGNIQGTFMGYSAGAGYGAASLQGNPKQAGRVALTT